MNLIIIHKGQHGDIVFGTDRPWFYFTEDYKTFSAIQMYRIGCFDLTPEEDGAIRDWIRESLKDGILQS